MLNNPLKYTDPSGHFFQFVIPLIKLVVALVKVAITWIIANPVTAGAIIGGVMGGIQGGVKGAVFGALMGGLSGAASWGVGIGFDAGGWLHIASDSP